jgi:hypothetical protein
MAGRTKEQDRGQPRQRFAAFGGESLFLRHAYFLGNLLPCGAAHPGDGRLAALS